MTAPDWWITALTQTVYGIRRNTRGITAADKWDQPGIRAAIAALAEKCSPADVARVMVNGADNPKLKTPAGVTAPGPQWADTTRASVRPPTPCPDHPDVPLTRCPCQRITPAPKPEDFWDTFTTARQETDQ